MKAGSRTGSETGGGGATGTATVPGARRGVWVAHGGRTGATTVPGDRKGGAAVWNAGMGPVRSVVAPTGPRDVRRGGDGRGSGYRRVGGPQRSDGSGRCRGPRLSSRSRDIRMMVPTGPEACARDRKRDISWSSCARVDALERSPAVVVARTGCAAVRGVDITL